jgi:hypothetical protein
MLPMATKTKSFAGVILCGIALSCTVRAHGQAPSPLPPPPGGGLTLGAAPFMGSAAPPPAPAAQALRIQPDIEVKQTSQPRTARGEVGLLVEVRNAGTIPVADLTLHSTLPAGVSLLGAEPPPERLRAAMSWTLGSLGAGEQRALRLLLQDSGGQVQALPFSASFRVSTTPAGGPSVPRPQMTVNGAPTAKIGAPLTLEVAVSNPGTALMRQAMLRILLPPGLNHAAGSDLENEVTSLGAGQTLTIPLTVTPTHAGKATVKLRLTPVGGEPIEIEHVVEVRQNPLSLTASGPAISQLREVCTCSFDVGNNSTEAVSSVILVVHLPDGISYLQSNDVGTYDPATHSVVWNLGDLPATKSRRITLQGVARQIGVQEHRLVLSAGQDRVKQEAWATRVMLPPTPGRQGE